MYERLGHVEAILQSIHPRFRIIRVGAGEALHDYIRRKGVFPSPTMRFCTRLFKVEPINAYLQNHLPCALMIGMNAEETDRVGALPLEGVRFEYPLQDLRLTRQSCIRLLREYDLEPRLPVYMRRGGCKFCFYKSRKEYAAIAHLDKPLAAELADFEDEINDGSARKHRWAIVKEIPEGLRKFFAEEQSSNLFSAEEMYRFEPATAESPCGVFCHR